MKQMCVINIYKTGFTATAKPHVPLLTGQAAAIICTHHHGSDLCWHRDAAAPAQLRLRLPSHVLLSGRHGARDQALVSSRDLEYSVIHLSHLDMEAKHFH